MNLLYSKWFDFSYYFWNNAPPFTRYKKEKLLIIKYMEKL